MTNDPQSIRPCPISHYSLSAQCSQSADHSDTWHETVHPDTGQTLRFRSIRGARQTQEWQSHDDPDAPGEGEWVTWHYVAEGEPTPVVPADLDRRAARFVDHFPTSRVRAGQGGTDSECSCGTWYPVGGHNAHLAREVSLLARGYFDLGLRYGRYSATAGGVDSSSAPPESRTMVTQPRRIERRVLAPPLAAPREPVDHARIGRRVVRRRAEGMDAAGAAAALEAARFDARQDTRYEHLADDERGRAELAEWERIGQVLSAAAPGALYDPRFDDVVQAELAAEAAAAAIRQTELREAALLASRADELQALRELGTLEQTEPREGDEAARDELTRRAGGYVQSDLDAWLAHALSAHLGHYRDPTARESAARLLSPTLLAHAALLVELGHLLPDAGVAQLAFAARLATTEPEAAGALAAFLARARSENA